MSKVDKLAEVPHSNQATLRRLDRHLRGSDNTFRLLFAEHDNIIHRADVIRDIGGERDFSEIHLGKLGTDFNDFERVLFAQAGQHRAVHVFGVEDFEDEDRTNWVQGWNYHRERIAEACPALVLLWLYPEHLTEFALEAPDMWAWRTSVLEFGSPAELMAAPIALGPWERKPAPANWRERLIEIEAYLQRIADNETEASDDVVAGLEAERGRLYLQTGQIETGRVALERARDSYEAHGDELQGLEQRVRWAEVTRDPVQTNRLLQDWLKIAKRGGESLLELRPEEQAAFSEVVLSLGELLLDTLPSTLFQHPEVFEYLLGAFTKARLPQHALRAGLAQLRLLVGNNKIDEAADVLEKNLIPSANRLGEERLLAIALTEFGHIQALQGRNGSALAILERVTTLARQLPDVYLAMVAQFHVAQILFARGEIEKCRRLLESQVLPVLKARSDQSRYAEGHMMLLGTYILSGKLSPQQKAVFNEAIAELSKTGDIVAQCRTSNQMADLVGSVGRANLGLELRSFGVQHLSRLPPLLKCKILTGMAKDHLTLGEPETALSILQDQVLPLQESDGRGQAVTRAEINRIRKAEKEAAAIQSPPSQQTNS